ncbi:MAG: orotidine-5'-phosphate decarboxylase [Candidatus Dadabacteria bacterium]|nr:MAG: orotidine-5'-phosphate decarboxylase [Candidatus Dadabacteria bacterium]
MDRFVREAARNKLIFALDVGSLREAGAYVRKLRGHVGMFKVGKQLFVKTGPRIIDYVHEHGGEVFLDLKFHDIPQTVARASVEATRLGVAMFNLHASGSFEMMRRAVAEVDRVCRTEHLRRPRMLAVTVLTSLSRNDLRRIGVRAPVEDQVVRLAVLAQEAGMDGVVASPLEIGPIRKACNADFLIVTPGIRRRGDAAGDQLRIAEPAEAIRAGADYVVVGRPIREAADPAAEADAIVEEIASALVRGPRRR